MRLIAPLTGRAQVIGLTGAPGVGKSTITGALVRAYRAQGLRVGVLAVDPTSPFSGGGALRRRVRRQGPARDSGGCVPAPARPREPEGLARASPPGRARTERRGAALD